MGQKLGARLFRSTTEDASTTQYEAVVIDKTSEPKNSNPAKESSVTLKSRISVQELSFAEKRLIKKTWQALGSCAYGAGVAGGQTVKGQEIFFRKVWLSAMSRSPRIKEILGVADEGSEREIWNSPKFQSLTYAVTEFFRRLIEVHHLDTDKILNECMELGVRHADFKPRGFQPVYWDIFLVCLVETLEKTCLPGTKPSKKWKVVYSWHKLVHLIVNQMLESYLEVRILQELTVSDRDKASQ